MKLIKTSHSVRVGFVLLSIVRTQFVFFKGCEFSNCYITKDMDYFGKQDTEKFDAIVFGMPHYISDEVSIKYISHKKSQKSKGSIHIEGDEICFTIVTLFSNLCVSNQNSQFDRIKGAKMEGSFVFLRNAL